MVRTVGIPTLLTMVALCAWPQRASAGGLFYSGSGTKALGRGAALHVGADNGLALLYNPAKLADVEGLQLLTDFNLAVLRACADLAGTREQQARDPLDPALLDDPDEGTYLDDVGVPVSNPDRPQITRFGALPPGTIFEKRQSWAGSQYPEVCADQDYLPIPSMVLSRNFVARGKGRRGLRGLTVAIGLVTPGAVANPRWGNADGTVSARGARPDVVCDPTQEDCRRPDASGAPTQYCDPERDYAGYVDPETGAVSSGCPKGADGKPVLPYFCDPTKYDCDLLPTPTRYMMVDTSPIAVPITLGVGYRPFRWLALGASFTYQYLKFQSRAVGPQTAQYLPELDGMVETSLVDPFVPVVSGGVVVTPVPGLDIGGYFRWSDDIEGPTSVRMISNYYTGEPQDRSARYNAVRNSEPVVTDIAAGEGLVTIAPMPWEVGAGFRYVHSRTPEAALDQMRDPMRDVVFDVEFNYVYERNSEVDRFELTSEENPFHTFGGYTTTNAQGEQVACDPSPCTGSLPFLARMGINRFWKDQHVFRLGGDWVAWPGVLALRAGFNFETRGVAPAYQSVDSFPARRMGFHGGLTLRLFEGAKFFVRTLELSLAYARLQQEEIVVLPDDAVYRDGAATRPRPNRAALRASSPDPNAFVVNAGKYTANYDVFSLGLRYAF